MSINGVRKKVFIKNTNISEKSQFVLIALGVRTVDDLHLMYLLNTIPTVVTSVHLFPVDDFKLLYTQEVNDEVKSLLVEYFDIEELDHVGV